MRKPGKLFRIFIGIKRNWKSFPGWAFCALGVIWAIIEPSSFLLPSAKLFYESHTSELLSFYIAIAFLTIFIKSFEPVSVVIPVKNTNTTITIEFGDLFASEGHLAIPVNEFFDSELGLPVSPQSLHGLFIKEKYNSDSSRFNNDVDADLTNITFQQVNRQQGRDKQYPIGTTVVVGPSQYKHFLFALSKTDPATCKASADVPTMWQALQGLWAKVRDCSNGDSVNIPLVGSGQSQVGLEPTNLLRLIIMSIINATHTREVTKEIKIIILPKYINNIDLRIIRKEWT